MKSQLMAGSHNEPDYWAETSSRGRDSALSTRSSTADFPEQKRPLYLRKMVRLPCGHYRRLAWGTRLALCDIFLSFLLCRRRQRYNIVSYFSSIRSRAKGRREKAARASRASSFTTTSSTSRQVPHTLISHEVSYGIDVKTPSVAQQHSEIAVRRDTLSTARSRTSVHPFIPSPSATFTLSRGPRSLVGGSNEPSAKTSFPAPTRSSLSQFREQDSSSSYLIPEKTPASFLTPGLEKPLTSTLSLLPENPQHITSAGRAFQDSSSSYLIPEKTPASFLTPGLEKPSTSTLSLLPENPQHITSAGRAFLRRRSDIASLRKRLNRKSMVSLASEKACVQQLPSSASGVGKRPESRADGTDEITTSGRKRGSLSRPSTIPREPPDLPTPAELIAAPPTVRRDSGSRSTSHTADVVDRRRADKMVVEIGTLTGKFTGSELPEENVVQIFLLCGGYAQNLKQLLDRSRNKSALVPANFQSTGNFSAGFHHVFCLPVGPELSPGVRVTIACTIESMQISAEGKRKYSWKLNDIGSIISPFRDMNYCQVVHWTNYPVKLNANAEFAAEDLTLEAKFSLLPANEGPPIPPDLLEPFTHPPSAYKSKLHETVAKHGASGISSKYQTFGVQSDICKHFTPENSREQSTYTPLLSQSSSNSYFPSSSLVPTPRFTAAKAPQTSAAAPARVVIPSQPAQLLCIAPAAAFAPSSLVSRSPPECEILSSLKDRCAVSSARRKPAAVGAGACKPTPVFVAKSSPVTRLQVSGATAAAAAAVVSSETAAAVGLFSKRNASSCVFQEQKQHESESSCESSVNPCQFLSAETDAALQKCTVVASKEVKAATGARTPTSFFSSAIKKRVCPAPSAAVSRSPVAFAASASTSAPVVSSAAAPASGGFGLDAVAAASPGSSLSAVATAALDDFCSEAAATSLYPTGTSLHSDVTAAVPFVSPVVCSGASALHCQRKAATTAKTAAVTAANIINSRKYTENREIVYVTNRTAAAPAAVVERASSQNEKTEQKTTPAAAAACDNLTDERGNGKNARTIDTTTQIKNTSLAVLQTLQKSVYFSLQRREKRLQAPLLLPHKKSTQDLLLFKTKRHLMPPNGDQQLLLPTEEKQPLRRVLWTEQLLLPTEKQQLLLLLSAERLRTDYCAMKTTTANQTLKTHLPHLSSKQSHTHRNSLRIWYNDNSGGSSNFVRTNNSNSSVISGHTTRRNSSSSSKGSCSDTSTASSRSENNGNTGTSNSHHSCSDAKGSCGCNGESRNSNAFTLKHLSRKSVQLRQQLRAPTESDRKKSQCIRFDINRGSSNDSSISHHLSESHDITNRTSNKSKINSEYTRGDKLIPHSSTPSHIPFRRRKSEKDAYIECHSLLGDLDSAYPPAKIKEMQFSSYLSNPPFICRKCSNSHSCCSSGDHNSYSGSGAHTSSCCRSALCRVEGCSGPQSRSGSLRSSPDISSSFHSCHDSFLVNRENTSTGIGRGSSTTCSKSGVYRRKQLQLPLPPPHRKKTSSEKRQQATPPSNCPPAAVAAAMKKNTSK